MYHTKTKMETSENKEIDKIKEKIIDLVLNIPLEKWNRTSTQINETTIFIEKKDNPIIGTFFTILINETIIYLEEREDALEAKYNELMEKSKKIEEEKEKNKIKCLYDILTCKNERFIETYLC